MITRITGKLVQLDVTTAYIEAGAFEYEVYVPDFVRRQLQGAVGQEVSLKTIEFLEGNPQRGGRLTPRMVGFQSEVERDFFEQFCSVDGVGIKKALQAMVRPVRDVAAAIEAQSVKELTLLPGIGPAVAERIVAKLRRKMTKFALMAQKEIPAGEPAQRDVIEETFEALLSLGHSPVEAREKLDNVLAAKVKFKTSEDLIRAIYQQEYA